MRARRSTPFVLFVALVGASAALGACGGGDAGATAKKVDTPAGATADVVVTIVDSPKTTWAFSPKSQPVKVGAVVEWKNDSSAVHNVTFGDSGPKSSHAFGKGESFKATFPTAGTFSYTCSIHPGMKAEVRVS